MVYLSWSHSMYAFTKPVQHYGITLTAQVPTSLSTGIVI
jgi:hypothetical protein